MIQRTVKTRKFKCRFFEILAYSKYILDKLDQIRGSIYELFEYLSIIHVFGASKRMFDRKTLTIIVFFFVFFLVCFFGWGYILCLPAYSSKFQFFETKPLVPRTSN